MNEPSLDELCELGQRQLMEMQYLAAEATLLRAERYALILKDWDKLSRLYMPLQEARRQRRQRCGEGVVCLDLLAEGPGDQMEARHVLEHYSHGQLLVAGWGSIEPAVRVREMAAKLGLYVETFLAAVFPIGAARAVVIAPTDEVTLPAPIEQSIDDLLARLPPHCWVLGESELPTGPRKGTYQTYGQVMSMWERLHRPFLAAADMRAELRQKIEGYRQTIEVDYACELAHQRLSDAARQLSRLQPASGAAAL